MNPKLDCVMNKLNFFQIGRIEELRKFRDR